MPRSSKAFIILGIAILAATVPAQAGVPDPATSDCTLAILQFPTRPACINNFNPDVLRLCPDGDFDFAIFSLVVRDVDNEFVVGAAVSAHEASGIVNITINGATTAVTDDNGEATIEIERASGHGLVSICADGVELCEVEVRSPDVNRGSVPTLCTLGTGSSFVNSADITNPTCGFLSKFGAVTTGVNDGWDLDCTGSVNGFDVIGANGALGHFGDFGTLGVTNLCP